jgi:hypothetical protein
MLLLFHLKEKKITLFLLLLLRLFLSLTSFSLKPQIFLQTKPFFLFSVLALSGSALKSSNRFMHEAIAPPRLKIMECDQREYVVFDRTRHTFFTEFRPVAKKPHILRSF